MRDRKKRILSILTALALALGLCTPLGGLVPKAEAASSPKLAAPVLDDFLVPVSQVTEVPTGYTGVYTATDLLAISDAPNGNYILMADIDLSGYDWTPLCNDSEAPFTGVFEGNGHVISSLNGVNGLFAYTSSVSSSAEIRNVGIENASIAAQYDDQWNGIIGGIVAYAKEDTTISNCYFQGDIDSNANTIGGIAGLFRSADPVEYCWMAGDIRSTNGGDSFNSPQVGGILAESGSSGDLTVNGCIHSGSIETEGYAMYAGGISGLLEGSISNCQNYGTITHYHSYANIGGIDSGLCDPVIQSCMNAADIQVVRRSNTFSNTRVGGISALGTDISNCFNCGDINTDGASYVGGITGENGHADNSYNVGTICSVNPGSSNVDPGYYGCGALFGSTVGTSSNCYYLACDLPAYEKVNGTPTLNTIRSLAADQMKKSGNFGGFDFDSVWTMGSGSYPYPVLRNACGTDVGSATPPSSSDIIPTPILNDPTCTKEGVSLSWTLPLVVPGEIHTVDGFYILRKTTGGNYQRVAQAGEYDSLYTDTSVQEGQTYTYTVQAYYKDQTGDYDQNGKTITWESSPLSISEVNISGGYPLLPLQGDSEVLLTLKEPLPERYLEDGKFTGSIRLMAGERLLANGTEVAYEPEYMDLYATFSPGEGGHFPPNTAAEIQVLNAEGHVIGRAPCKTYFQQWAVANFSSQDAAVPERLIYLMLWGENSDGWAYETRADQLVGRGVEIGKGGFCFGMALAVSLVNWLGTYDFGAYDILDETGNTVQKLSQVDMEGEFSGINAVEFIQLCHIAQYLWPIQNALDENRWNCSGLLREIDQYKAGECPMPIAWISSTDSKTKDKSSHALGAYDYRLDGGDAYILCYDCNLPGGRKELKLSNYKDAGSAAWSFETLGWQGSQQGNSDNYFTYYTPEKDSDIFIYAEQSSSAILLSVSDQNTLKQVEVTGGLELTTISHLASSYLTADASPFRGGMAWLTGKGTLTLSDATGEATLADGVAAYSVKGAEGWSSELSKGTVTELSAQGQSITLSCTYYTEDGNQVEVSFNGDSDDSGKDMSVSRTGDTVHFSGGEKGTVTVTYENGKTWTEQVEPGKDLSVTADGKNEPSTGGKNEPSTGDKNESSTNGTVSQKPDSVRFFDDISSDDYFYDAVVWAVENGITTGTGANTFSPYRPCTRAEVVTLLWRALSLDESSARAQSNPFVDVENDDYFRDAVLWAAEYGITSGTDKSHFSPDKTCTRAEVVTFLWRSHFPTEVVMDGTDFRDVSSTSYYFLPVSWAVKEGITSGTGKDTFSPNMVCTRSQVVTFLYRYFGD